MLFPFERSFPGRSVVNVVDSTFKIEISGKFKVLLVSTYDSIYPRFMIDLLTSRLNYIISKMNDPGPHIGISQSVFFSFFHMTQLIDH